MFNLLKRNNLIKVQLKSVDYALCLWLMQTMRAENLQLANRITDVLRRRLGNRFSNIYIIVMMHYLYGNCGK
jgi:phenylpyruvate tautomerase PptA (4-oxalocrotonate tautomerase family)